MSIDAKLIDIEAKLVTREDLDCLFLRIRDELKADFDKKFTEQEEHFNEELTKRDSRIGDLEKKIGVLEEKLDNLEEKVSDPALIERNVFERIPTDDPWEVSPSREKEGFGREILLIGDSIIRDVNALEIFPDKTCVQCCMPGKGIEEVTNELEKSTKNYSFKNIVIHAGTNDIKSPDQDPTQLVMDICHMLKNTKLNNPNSNVYYSALLPKYGPHFNEINTAIFSSQKIFDFTFIQHSCFSQYGHIDLSLYRLSEVNRKSPAPLHLSRKGNVFFTRNLYNYLT